MDALWRLKVGFVVAVFLGCAHRALAHARQHERRQDSSCPAYVKDRITFAIAPGARPPRRTAPRLHGRGRGGDPRQARPLRRRDAPGARDDLRLPLRRGPRHARRADEARRRRSTSPQPETAIIRLKFKDPADKSKIDDRFNKKFLERARRDARPGRRRGHLQDPRGGRVADPRARRRAGEGHGHRAASTSSACARRRSRRATRTSSSRCPAANEASFDEIKEIIRRPPASSSRWSTTPAATRSSAASAQGRRPPAPARASPQYQESAPDGLDGRRHRASRSRRLRAHVVPAAEVRERDDARVPRALQGVGDDAATSPTTTSIGFEAVTEPVDDTEPLQFKQVGWRTLYLYAPRRA